MMGERGTDESQIWELLASDPERASGMVSAMVAERASTDPRFALLAGLLDRGEESLERADRVQRMHERITGMREDLAELHERNKVLALALGACPSCWGQVPACSECDGEGAPGWLQPDPPLFDEFVAPALARRRRDLRKPIEDGSAQ